MTRLDRRSAIIALIVSGLTVLSLSWKLANQYGFFIYPDSYYYLLIAENLRDHLHPTGTLGAGGMSFPPQGYAAMKVTYPLLVAIGLVCGLPTEPAGHVVATLAAVACVPLAYLSTSRLTDSRAAGLLASMIAATSYGLTYWSGFVMSDSASLMLSFLMLWILAKQRPDQWGNAGDLALGVCVAVLLLSRPTYIVALPFIAWLGFRRWGWTSSRGLTATAAAALTVSTAAMLWFPPSSFSGKVLGNLMPLLVGLAVLAAVALFLARKVTGNRVSPDGMALYVLALSGAAAILSIYAAERVTDAFQNSFYIGLGRFAVRDAAVLVALLPGSWMLARVRRWDVAFALNATAVSLLVVYFWAEPRESRYVLHLLPFLIPVASGSALIVARLVADGVLYGLRHWPAALLSLCVLTPIFGAVAYQGSQSATTAGAAFLESAYPREVAERLQGSVPDGATVLSALPWPYYFHLRHATWGAGVAYSDELLELLPAGRDVFVLEDASLRFHDRKLARAIAQVHRPTVEFAVPMAYQYGYSSVADSGPVRGYTLSPAELKSIVDSLTSEAGAPKNEIGLTLDSR